MGKKAERIKELEGQVRRLEEMPWRLNIEAVMANLPYPIIGGQVSLSRESPLYQLEMTEYGPIQSLRILRG